ncbi:uncharacterized protein LOC134665394 [Cydia fagiglandana]|uniref:uncharacterized protein LOC134665394 n=1 Tax=Cydia fagiglandana TaxID=1458189 RepID=UPI002FEE6466
MDIADAMFIFEVVVEHVRSLVDSRLLVIRSDFADIFSLELKDPKQMHIVMPEPLPLPPEPPGMKKKKKPKPKPKKKKKGALPPPPPPEPVIQSGQSVLFTSSAEFLIKLMLKCPLQVTLWSKEDNLVFIGASVIPWDPIFLTYLKQIVDCQNPKSVTVRDEYNVFEEDTAKLMAKIGLQIKLSYLGDKVTTSFRTLSEDPTVKKVLYTGINSKTTSYICTMKTTDEVFEENSNKIENSFIKDRLKPITFADYTNAPGANLVEFSEGDYCCMNNADKPPESKYRAPITMPTIDFIIDYVRKIIASCNDNMRMLTPRPTITPKIRATDIDRLCYCQESQWPESELAEKYKIDVQSGPCAVCAEPGKTGGVEGPGAIFDIANIRGPCGKPDCKIARHIRKYIENLMEEDKVEVNINEIIGPCGSKLCTLAEKIQEFLRHEGVFTADSTKEGLSTQCACIQKMQDALAERKSCHSICCEECEEADDPEDTCGGKGCPFSGHTQQVYNVYYFTVELDQTSNSTSGKTTPVTDQTTSDEDKFKFCAKDCPTMKAETEITLCTKGVCPLTSKDKPCPEHPCPVKGEYPPSPADSNVEIELDAIHNPCCSTTCDVAETVKDFIVDGLNKKSKINEDNENECYCDCVCDFNFTKNTTYCAVCGGYECLGTDMENQPAFIKPLPCPVYHKLYDKKYIKTESPWPDEEQVETQDRISVKTTRSQKFTKEDAKAKKDSSFEDEGWEKEKKKATKFVNKKKPNKRNVGAVQKVGKAVEKRPLKYSYPPVPANMGWNWTAEDIPGLKPRPQWKPGAAIKPLVRRYRALRDGIDIIKKKRALMTKKKKIESKPLLIVTKKDGEYTVQMEVFKKYSKERLLFQYPYEEKPPLIYTIGKTEEEKTKIKKQRERRERRETRRKCRLLQSTFRDKCQEICVKAYNQAIGVLPLPNPNNPECPCYTKPADAMISPTIDSCSCSEEESISSSDTDGDDWIIEFSPPASKYDAKVKHPPVTAENESQYTYLDYKVKLLDKQGNQVPRFFKGPDGKKECSDLGGFWDHNHVWQEINKDGYIGPDGRWIPLSFVGPDGMMYSSEEGGFTDKDGNTFKLGIDGYVDKDGKWVWYKAKEDKSKSIVAGKCKGKESPIKNTAATKQTKATATDAKAGKSGSGDAKAKPNKSNLKRCNTKPTKGSQKRSNNYQVMTSMSTNFDMDARQFRSHSVKLPKLSKRIRAAETRMKAQYREILKPLEEYSDIGLFKKPGGKVKPSRACNTPLRQRSPVLFECPGNMNQIQPVCSFEFNSNTSIC